MSGLSDSLRDMGFTPTGEESPVDESGELWTNHKEIICDETGTVIDGDHHTPKECEEQETHCGERVYRYRNSEKVKLYGGYSSAYSGDGIYGDSKL